MAVVTQQQSESSATAAPVEAADALVVFGITGDLAPGTRGPSEADQLLSGVANWHGPWVQS